ncbi:bactofilin family protein [Vibrio mediterranei]|uniref:bactofilin family protein n=1 Tax=Vibrio mediterranei TaxID=689 RepID=UPI0040683009
MGIFSKAVRTRVTEISILGANSNVKGDVKTDHTISIEGLFEGTVQSETEVTVTAAAKVVGDIKANQVIIDGLVQGNITCDQILLLSNGVVKGSIECKTISANIGARIVGSVKTTSATANLESNKEVASISSRSIA